MNLKHRENITVERKIPVDKETDNTTRTDENGQQWERIEIWNFVNVSMAHQARGSGRSETYLEESRIEIGGGGKKPDYVTEWLAEQLWHEYGIDLPHEAFDIDVIDIESDEIIVL